MRAMDEPFVFPRTNIKVRNRSVLAAMTNKQSHKDGTISDDEIHWLALRAKGGFAIVTTAAANVQQYGKGWDGEIGVYSDVHVPGLTQLAREIHQHGSIGLVQIFHGGMRAPEALNGVRPVSASENIEAGMEESSRALTHDEIESLIQDFADAAQRCEKAGFDGVELHGAHSYLICQFLGTVTNRRKDKWGGTLQNRARFLQRIYEAIRKVTSHDFLVGVRLSPVIEKAGITLSDTLEVSRWCKDWGMDFLHISCWDIFSLHTNEGDEEKTLTRWFTDDLKGTIPIITTGAIWDQADVDFAIGEGANLIGVARAGIAHPTWPEMIRTKGEEIQRPPFHPRTLRHAGLNETFISYMKRWKNFVSEDE